MGVARGGGEARVAEHDRIHKRIERTPGVQIVPVDVELVRRRQEGEPVRDDVAVRVNLDIGDLAERGIDVRARQAERRDEPIPRHRLPLGEQPHELRAQSRAGVVVTTQASGQTR